MTSPILNDTSTVIQLAISPKGLDATAITAADTIRRLLGFGDRLAAIRRQRWMEIILDGSAPGTGTPDGDSILVDLDAYVGSSFGLWNPNKERCWIRLQLAAGEANSAEYVPNLGRREASWGDPGLSGESWDHLVIWEAAGDTAVGPASTPVQFGGTPVARVASGEVYSFRWGEEAEEHTRRNWIDELAVVRGRHQGLLVQPHYQDHAVYCGPLPLGLGS